MRPFICLIFFAFSYSIYGQSKPGDGKQIIQTDSIFILRDTAYNFPVLNDVASAYDNMESALETMYNKLIKDAKDNKEELEKKIEDLNKQIEDMKKQILKLQQAIAKIEEMIKEMEELKDKALNSIRQQKEKTLMQIIMLLKDKKQSSAQLNSKRWVTQINNAKEDSLRKIKLKYNN